MSRLRSFSSIILTCALSLSVGLLPAAAEDEQWPNPDDPRAGSHIVSIQDSLQSHLTYSKLLAYRAGETLVCKSVDDSNCKGAERFDFVALLPICETQSAIDCIESLTATDSQGRSSEAVFDRYTYENHPNMFLGKRGQTIQNPSSPSVWKMAGVPHGFGDEYALAVSLSGGFGPNGGGENQLNMNLYAVSKLDGRGEFYDRNGFSNFAQCNQIKNDKGKLDVGCGEGAEEYGKVRCALKVQKMGGCLLQHAFPSNQQFKVSLRLSEEPTGWFHGRMKSPTVQVEKLAGAAVKISVQAMPTNVPVFYQSKLYAEMPEELKAHWDKCLKSGTCSSGTRIFGNDPNKEPDGNLRNAIHSPQAFGATAINAVNFYGKYAEDKSVASPSLWSARSLSSGEMNGANGCFKNGSGLKGILTTNATAYSEGPPKFVNGFLKYQVAGLHYAADGKTLNEGVYDMVMRSSVARCLYGFSSAPISATVSVLASNGEKKVATTVVSEKNGWLKLAAYGFTYSSPTINVKLTQGKIISKKTSITCVYIKSKKIVKTVTAVNPKCPVGYKKK
jgi:hypothetical protein